MLAVATTSLLASAPIVHAEVRTGTAGPGTMNPAAAHNRIAGGLLTYETGGRLEASVRLAGDPRAPGAASNSVVVYAGTWRDGRCVAVPGTPRGFVGGMPDTFGLPPYPDPNFFYQTQIKLAAVGDATLDPTSVSVFGAGESLTLSVTNAALADRPWNCGLITVSDQSDGADARGFPRLDETAAFPLVGPRAGLSVAGRALAVRGGRLPLRLRNTGAAASGTVTVAGGGVTLVARAPYAVEAFASERLSPRLTSAGRALLRERGRVRAKVTLIARGGRRTTATVTVRG